MSVTTLPAILVLTEADLPLARRIATTLGEAEVHGLEGRVAGADVAFAETGTQLRRLFAAGRPIIGICAAGILIRTLGPMLSDKTAEPPVIAVAADGSAVVPLLGGHRGANDLARRLAAALSVSAAITTASELRFGLALDAPPPGWQLANPEDHKAFAAALLAGAKVKLEGAADWLDEAALPRAEDGALTITVTEMRAQGSESHLVYHPACLALGVGCERGTDPEEVIALAERCLAAEGIAPAAVAGVFSLALKSDEPAMHALATHLARPARFFDAPRLEAERARLTAPSEVVYREVGCHGVAEGAALAAVGAEGALIVPKTKSARATCAIARAAQPFDATQLGRPRGRLTVAGLGPGDPLWRTPEVAAAVTAASDLVGYGLYLDLLGPLAIGKQRHDFALGEEEARVRAALDLAAEGREVVLISSGDPGIYAMAALVFELLEREERADWGRIALSVMPGISALQAAAARCGAPLGHDFCTISLSDLLTPWPVIERRLTAAAAGDFVVALYNPVSRRRRHQFEAALTILGSRRSPETPVILARNLGRPGETLQVLPLAEVTVDAVDMLTVVLIGSRETRSLPRGDGGRWVYTPRGYAVKMDGIGDGSA